MISDRLADAQETHILAPKTPSPERRSKRRTRLALPVRIQLDGLCTNTAIETAQNHSGKGLYFITQQKAYRPGMRLRLVFPYFPSNHDIIAETYANVVRVEELSHSRFGIAVRFLHR